MRYIIVTNVIIEKDIPAQDFSVTELQISRLFFVQKQSIKSSNVTDDQSNDRFGDYYNYAMVISYFRHYIIFENLANSFE